jgi:hypothetical protein
MKNEEKNSGQSAVHCDLQAVRDILQEQELTEVIINQWVDIGKEEFVCHTLMDEDIAESVINEKKMKGSDVEMEIEEEPVDVPTDQEALQGLETVIGWLGSQQDFEQIKIMQLVSLKYMILKKRLSHNKQQTITDFLKK